MTGLPAPLLPKEVSLGPNDWFPFYFQRLRKSRWWRRASDMARARNVMLWGESYSQTPAGSLPDDDTDLADAAGFGLDVKGFQAVKDEIMAPWTLCSDGRWYHPTMCEVALETWELQSAKRKADAERKRRSRERVRGPSEEVTRDTPPKEGAKPPPVTRDKAIQTDKTDRTDTGTTPSASFLAPGADEPGEDALVIAMYGDPGPDAPLPPEPPSPPPPADPPQPPPEPESKKAKPRRGRVAPDTWAPKPGHDTLAFGELGMTSQQFDRELAKFRDHEFQTPKADWDRTFNNWLRKAAESLPRGTSHDRRTEAADRRLDNLRRALTAPSLVAGRTAS